MHQLFTGDYYMSERNIIMRKFSFDTNIGI